MFSNRQKLLFKTVLQVVFPILLIMPCVSSAVVKEVTIFPHSARVEETVKVNPQPAGANKHLATFILPAQADPESLIVSLPPAVKTKIDDLQMKPVERVDENRIAQLRAQIKKLQNEKMEIQARLQGLDVQLQFWQAQTKAKTKSVAEADNLAAAIGKNSRKIYSEKYSLDIETGKIDKQIKELQDSLNQAAGKNEKVWEATLTLSGPVPTDFVLNYSYTLGGCGWLPLYRLEAAPASKSILFSWEAEIWQSSGEDWKQASISLATLQPVKSITPQELSSWIIKPRTTMIPKSSRRASAPASLKMAELDDAAAPSTPVETLHTTYSVWSLGKKTVTAGSRQRIQIKEETWPAQFLFLARPSQSSQAFLQAQIKLPKPVDIPAGLATFVIDGAVLGKRTFALAGSDAEIYFGVSPLVRVSMATIADQSGAKRIFQDKQTRQWQWLIEAKNAGAAPIQLRIEEPVAQARDERIKLTYKHLPQPTEKDATKFVWMLDLPALQKKSIEIVLEFEAPQDMDVDYGLRR